MAKLPKLPSLLDRKIYKTGQTRGADDDVIFQNRVARNSTVLIPLSQFEVWKKAPDKDGKYDSGYIVLVKPEEYFEKPGIPELMKEQKIELGKNALVFYETREQWFKYSPEAQKWKFATARTSPLGGEYVARVPATTAEEVEKILHGYTTNGMKGAGIRVYEYSSDQTTKACRLQLELLYWRCENSREAAKFFGMTDDGINVRVKSLEELAEEQKLFDIDKLKEARIINAKGITTCPLCLKPISANGFFNKLSQAEGRDVPDLTVTEINLFHIRELRLGEFNHKPYNLGWGHHHCNVVTKDSGIIETLKWIKEILEFNKAEGFDI